MAYTTTGISGIVLVEHDGGAIIRARSSHADKCVQLYISGRLTDWQHAPAESVEFAIGPLRDEDIVFLLAVDVGEEDTDYWDDAFGVSADYGNRILFSVPQLIKGFGPHDQIKFYRGEAGDESATTLVHQRDFYLGGRRSGGFGHHFGYGGFGWDGHDAKGFGYNFGYGEFGFDCDMIQWKTEPLPPGVYPYKIIVVDLAGNESTAATGTLTLDTYARPASGLTVESYDKATDALELSFTASEDI